MSSDKPADGAIQGPPAPSPGCAPHSGARYVPRDEFLTFARAQLASPQGNRTPAARTEAQRKRRPSTQIYAERAAHFERPVLRLRELEQRQTERLAHTREARRTARRRLRDARGKLEAEIATACRATGEGAAAARTEKEPPHPKGSRY